MEQARKIWNEMIIQKGLGKSAQNWIEFYEFENQFGEDKHKRKVLLRSLNEAIDMQDVLCDMLRRFEKQNGTTEQIITANKKIEAVMKKYNEAREVELKMKKPVKKPAEVKEEKKKRDEVPKKDEKAKASVKRKVFLKIF